MHITVDETISNQVCLGPGEKFTNGGLQIPNGLKLLAGQQYDEGSLLPAYIHDDAVKTIVVVQLS